MPDKIDRFLASLDDDGLAECKRRLDAILKRPRGRPQGLSQDPRMIRCRLAAAGVLFRKADFADQRKLRRVPNDYVKILVEDEMEANGFDPDDEQARETILSYIRRQPFNWSRFPWDKFYEAEDAARAAEATEAVCEK